MTIRYLLVLTILLLSTSCAQLSLFQDAKTVGKGNLSMGGNLSAFVVKDDGDNDVIAVPSMTGFVSYGLADKIDMQASLSSTLGLLLAPKVQLLGHETSKFALAAVPGLGIQAGSYDGEDLGPFRTHYAMIASYHPHDKLSCFVEPRYIVQYRSDQINDIFYGCSAGVKFDVSDKMKLSLGTSIFEVKKTPEQLYQLSLGLHFMINKKEK